MTFKLALTIIFEIMLAIKLKGVGKKHQRSFRVVLQEQRSKLRGKSIEDFGWYNPHTDKYEVKAERVLYWLGCGAKPTATVGQILKKAKIAIL
ncbi:MAG: 30S ribosomal protein S16 [Candidatus Colwellbacteria bacterium]|nr:30S ribosomal protein S16 [Candidatus Colwellbacteria bacterium]